MCPQCGRTYADDLIYCLQDGSALAPEPNSAAEPEEPTVVRPPRRAGGAPMTSGMGPAGRSAGWVKWAIPAALLLLLAAAAAVAAILFLRPMLSPSSDEQAAAPTATPAGRQRPAEDRPAFPSPTPTPSKTETPAITEVPRENRNTDESEEQDDETGGDERFSDPGPSRITFRRGADGETVTGRISRERSFLLYTMAGQRLSARVQSGAGCVEFAGGGTSTGFSTSQGDSRVRIVNNCDRPARFTLSVTVR